MFTTPAPFRISDLDGYRYTVVGYSPLEGYRVVSKIVTDTAEQAAAELTELMESPDYSGWVELYTLNFDAFDFELSGLVIAGGRQIR